MSRIIQLEPGSIIVGDAEVVVEIAQAKVQEVALEVALLGRDLSDTLCIMTPKGPQVALRLLNEPHRRARPATIPESAGRARVSRGAQQHLRFDIPLNLLGYLEATLLRAYRDGMAKVDHIHIEGVLDVHAFDLTVMFETARPPMTPEEVERRMKGP